jgi:hypothetical protein
LDVLEAERIADELVTAELAKSSGMWGGANERSDVANGELFCAGLGQLDAIFDRRNGEEDAFDSPPMVWPEGWSGFRSYGEDIPNIVVAIAYLTNEVKRLLLAGEDYTRLERRADQPYNPATGLPNTVEA